MKILIIRHGDPDYSIDSLTEKGWKEAEYLSEKIAPLCSFGTAFINWWHWDLEPVIFFRHF